MGSNVLIQPFKQRVIWVDPVHSDGRSCIDKLHKDLTFHRTEFSFKGTPEQTFMEAVKQGIIKPDGWVVVNGDFYDWNEIWPEAVKLKGSGKTYKPTI